MIENRFYKSLELDKILQMLADCTGCEDSRHLSLQIEPKTSLRDAQRLMDKTSDAYVLSYRFGAPSLRGLKNVTGSLKRAQMGATLSLSELLDIERFLKASREMKNFRKNFETENATSLDDLFDSLMPNQHLEEKIAFTVISEDEINDNASPELADIRRKIRNSQLRVKEHLEHLIHSQTYSKYLQEPIVTIRDGRYCVPVKVEYRTEIRGLVHDTSGSGSTIFIEPDSVVEDNNETRVLKSKEIAEIQRILYELSSEIASNAEIYIQDYSVLVELDLYFAKARLAMKMKAVVPALTDDCKIKLIKARHPLIPNEKIVPVDISLGYDFDVLVITGPNTGGKTVTLKTLGLLTLMSMCGLMIPAAENSSISVFDDVFADIGDEQSIEQSLSTFSSHINNTIKIIEKADNHSLVLLDELGAGTDPVEGAALAISIIEKLKSFGTKIVATTHYSEMKIYALDTPRVENACCEFDIETLSPTYRLLIGVPGKSNAFAITEKLGMDLSVVDRAKELVSAENSRFEDVVEKLERSRQELENEYESERENRIAAQKIREELEKEKKEFEHIKEKELEKARTSARKILDDVRNESQRLLDDIETIKKNEDKKTASDILMEARAQVKNGVGKISDLADPVVRENAEYVLPRKLVKGDVVKINGSTKEGTVMSVPDGAGNLTVQIGIIKTKLNISDIRLIEKTKKAVNNGKVRRNIESVATRHVTSEVDIRGMDAEEGVMTLENYIAECLLTNVKTFYVIHGKGTGILRSAVHSYLKKCKYVSSYRLGVYGEGEDGVTVVELK